MNKMFLVITSSRSKTSDWEQREQYVRDFYFGLKDMIKDTDVAYTTYDDIECLVRNGKVAVRDTRHDIDLKDVSLVHFKNWMFNYEEASLIAFYLKSHGVRYFNAEVDAGLAWGKIPQMCRLAIAGVPVPDTYFAKKPRLATLFQTDSLPTGFDFPLILKADDGAKGNDNHLVRDAKEALEVLAASEPDKQYVVQNFIPNEGDYRVLFVGLDDDPLVFLRTAVIGSHLNNTSQGGSGRFIEPSDLPAGYIEIARLSAKTLNREISGVDIIVDSSTGKPYILEVNSTPALATGYGVDVKQAKFAKFLQKELAAKTEVAGKLKPIIGKLEPLTFVDGGVNDLPAKVDTGAYRSSIWATNIREENDTLHFTLLGPSSPFYSGKELSTKQYRLVQVENSFGHSQERYSVFLKVRLGGKTIRSNFTLANRSTKTYSALIGRKMLKGRFVVDVTEGQPINGEYGDESLI